MYRTAFHFQKKKKNWSYKNVTIAFRLKSIFEYTDFQFKMVSVNFVHGVTVRTNSHQHHHTNTEYVMYFISSKRCGWHLSFLFTCDLYSVNRTILFIPVGMRKNEISWYTVYRITGIITTIEMKWSWSFILGPIMVEILKRIWL